MTEQDPLSALGLEAGASLNDIRLARRRLAKAAHPDRGGSTQAMQYLNEMAERAARQMTHPAQEATGVRAEPDTRPAPPARRFGRWVGHEAASFVIHSLPVEAFEDLLIVGTWLGEVVDDDPPYRLDLLLSSPGECLCRLDLVPDAGASTVSISIAHIDGGAWPTPSLDDVRDTLIAAVNALD